MRATVESIKAQNRQPNEHIIVDGTSVDQSLDFIALEKRDNAIIHLLDSGQGVYEVMNIGLKECSTEYVVFLNSGDYFYNKNSLKHLASEALDNEIVYGCIAIKAKHSDFLLKRPAEQIHYHKKYQHNLPFGENNR